MTPYQGIAALDGKSIAESAQAYFAQSEQLPTRFSLSFGRSTEAGQPETWRAGGVMLQHMPKASPYAKDAEGSGGSLQAEDLLDGDASENWNRANILLDTVEEMELIGPMIPPCDLLVRLFSEEKPRVYEAQPIKFGCTCSEDRVRQSLSIYSARDIATMTLMRVASPRTVSSVVRITILIQHLLGWKLKRLKVSDLISSIRSALGEGGDPSSDFDLNPDFTKPADRVLRPAGVLAPVIIRNGVAELILTKRSSALKHHPGPNRIPWWKAG